MGGGVWQREGGESDGEGVNMSEGIAFSDGVGWRARACYIGITLSISVTRRDTLGILGSNG